MYLVPRHYSNGKLVSAGVASSSAVFMPEQANARDGLKELHGVPEQIGTHMMALDSDWAWFSLLVFVVVGAVAFYWHRRDQ